MQARETEIQGCWLIEGTKHSDSRGWFREWYKKSTMMEFSEFVPEQANISLSQAGVIRGIHYSMAPRGQAKLVTVMSGAINDYVVDIRLGSPTYGTWLRFNLAADQPRSLLIGTGLGHAFQALVDNTVISYLLSSEFDPALEMEINPFSKDLSIDWSDVLEPVISDKDLHARDLSDAASTNRLPNFK